MGKSALAVLGDDLKHWLRIHTLAVTSTLVLVVVNLFAWLVYALLRVPKADQAGMPLSDFLAHPPMAAQPSTPLQSDLPGQFAKLLLTLFITSSPFQLIVDAALVLLILCIAEPRLGRRRTVLASLISAVSGAAVGLAICYAINELQSHWTWFVRIPMALNPVILVIGALMAASSFSNLLWRRRIHLIGYASLILLVLYTGNPGNYCALAAALIGHLTGRIWHGPITDRTLPGHRSYYETRHLLGAISAVLALGPIVTASSKVKAGIFTPLGMFMGPGPTGAARLQDCLRTNTAASCYTQYGLSRPVTTATFIGLLVPTAVMLVVSWGIYHGRRVAAMTSLVLNGLTVVLALVYYLVVPLTLGEGLARAVRHGAVPSLLAIALPPLIFAYFICRYMRYFPVRTKAGLLRAGSLAILLDWLITAGLYLAAVTVSPGSFKPRPNLSMALAELPARYLTNGVASRFKPRFVPRTLTGQVINNSVGFIFWLVVLVVLLLWMRSSVLQNEDERLKANALVESGGESMSFMTTWEGNNYWFSPSGRSAIAYRVLHGIALTTTGPFGDPHEYQDDLHEFWRYCTEHSWSPVFYSIHKPQRDDLVAHGWASLEVGSEMVVIPSQWETRGKKWQDIRTAINKAKKSNYRDELSTFNDAPWDVQSQIVAISEQWAELKALPEMKFTLGGLDELRDPRVAILYAIDAEGTVLGVTSWMPTYRDGKIIGWTLDFMRHRTDSPNGIMEFLIARMAERLRDEGQVEFMSLSAAPLAGMNPERDNQGENTPQILQHALQLVADLMEPAYGFRSLFFFKKKFQPAENPVYICYPDPAQLVQIGLSVVQAYLPDLKASQALDALKSLRPAKNEAPRNGKEGKGDKSEGSSPKSSSPHGRTAQESAEPKESKPSTKPAPSAPAASAPEPAKPNPAGPANETVDRPDAS
ncbi:Lysylcardiolipin synthase/Lysyltransferase [Bifidobacterium actinocoloniiforme DSM 22766]|uniref:Lysylcardiolipin synthase/Lysyltransferase n=2 Tax=Bifidobacterium actinocoloniiforme TaxID=638619 RepID=A0A086Z1F0_9BIFI|nr:Lysylcardiolipin synthase/Lysyltransferase [Bifidobacterium actinocoloniiforme DSM 22766]